MMVASTEINGPAWLILMSAYDNCGYNALWEDIEICLDGCDPEIVEAVWILWKADNEVIGVSGYFSR